MSSDLHMLRRGLDDALRSAREAGSRRFDWLIRRRVVVVPRAIARLLPRFAAGVCLSIVFIDPRLAGAPPPAIRYLMAHEWGHVDRGHIPCAFVALAAALSRVALASSPQSLGTQIAELLILLVTGLLLFGKSVMRRELEADAFAAGIVGRAQAADSLAWLVEWRGKGWPRDLRARYDFRFNERRPSTTARVNYARTRHGCRQRANALYGEGRFGSHRLLSKPVSLATGGLQS